MTTFIVPRNYQHFVVAGPLQQRSLISPNKLNRSVSIQQTSTPQTPLPSLRGPQLLKENMSSSMSRSAAREKAGGPPTNSLLFTPNRYGWVKSTRHYSNQ